MRSIVLYLRRILYSMSILFAVMMSISVDLNARICYSTGNGNWTTASTWDSDDVPVGDDTLVIQSGDTVTIDANLTYSGNAMFVHVYGVWIFDGGGSKISLPCGSEVQIFSGGTLIPTGSGGGSSQTVKICNNIEWYRGLGTATGPIYWPIAALPVELLYFEASSSDGNVRLEWSTATEANTASFEIYRSSDLGCTEKIAEVPASGNSPQTQYYTYNDVPNEQGLWYYCLVEREISGATERLAQAAVDFYRPSSFNCWSDTYGDNTIWFENNGSAAGVEVIVIDPTFRIVYQEKMDLVDHELTQIALDKLGFGIYSLVVIDTQNIRGRCRLLVQ